MKTKMIYFITFCCMVIVLGTQALLRGTLERASDRAYRK